MTNGDWWDRAKLRPRPETILARPRDPVCTLLRDQHVATLETRAVTESCGGADSLGQRSLAPNARVQGATFSVEPSRRGNGLEA